jgi:Fe-S-cluster containining protein
MQTVVTQLENHQTFRFSCSPQVPCFNACCRDLNQVLTPHDVLCLKQYLEMTSTDFLNAYTRTGTGSGTGLPVVGLRFCDSRDLACPFVTPEGCRVYPARPASCRTYPLARGVARDRQTGALTEHWALIREPHCRGFEGGRSFTVEQWVDNQQIAVHNRMNDRMLELIAQKNRFRPGVLPPSEENLVYTALYDLDAFRGQIDAAMADMPADDLPERDLSDDVDLLDFALDWVRRKVLEGRPLKPDRSGKKERR